MEVQRKARIQELQDDIILLTERSSVTRDLQARSGLEFLIGILHESLESLHDQTVLG